MGTHPRKKTYKGYPTQARLRELFTITPEGKLKRLVQAGKRGKQGEIVGRAGANGSIRFTVEKRDMQVAHVIWKMLHDEYPAFIGYRDGNLNNTHPDNLFNGFKRNGKVHAYG